MKFFNIIFVFVFCLNTTYGQDTKPVDPFSIPLPDSVYEKAFRYGLKQCNMKFNPPKGFVNYSISHTKGGIFYQKKSQRHIASFVKLLINSDSSIAIGLKTYEHTKAFNLTPSQNVDAWLRAYQDMTKPFRRLNTDTLKSIYNASFGIEFSAKNLENFIDMFPNHKIQTMGDEKREIIIVFFYKDQDPKLIDKFISENARIVELQ